MTIPLPWSSIPAAPQDIRLVVCDMDGTLLRPSGEVPEAFWSLLETMRDRGLTFVPASGRQYATLAAMFDRVPGGLPAIAENGSLVVHDGVAVSTTPVDASTVREVVDAVRAAPASDDLGLVVCGVASAYVERSDAAFVAEVRRYYARLTVVDDLDDVSDDVLKLAVYAFGDAARTAATTLGALAASHQVVVSGEHWVDIMRDGVDKGLGVQALQAALGVTPAQTVVFGDYLNDLEMLDAGEWSFAMANAHPDIQARARYLAPSNTEDGVVTVLTHLLGVAPQDAPRPG